MSALARFMKASQPPPSNADESFVHTAAATYPKLRDYASVLKQADQGSLVAALRGGDDSWTTRSWKHLAETTSASQQPQAAQTMLEHNTGLVNEDTKAKLAKCSTWASAAKVVDLGPIEEKEKRTASAIGSYVKLVDGVKINNDGEFALYQEDANKFWKGGWKTQYQQVTLPRGAKYNHQEQKNAVFSIPKKDVAQFLEEYELEWCKDAIDAHIRQGWGKYTTHEYLQVHVMFYFSPQVHYAYHIDAKDLSGKHPSQKVEPDVTAVFQLSPGNSSMHYAGAAEEYKYLFPGDGCMFQADGYHRSGRSEIRTVKVAFFVKIVPQIDLDEVKKHPTSSSSAGEEVLPSPAAPTTVKKEKFSDDGAGVLPVVKTEPNLKPPEPLKKPVTEKEPNTIEKGGSNEAATVMVKTEGGASVGAATKMETAAGVSEAAAPGNAPEGVVAAATGTSSLTEKDLKQYEEAPAGIEQADPVPGEPSAVLAADAVGATVPEADADCGDVLKKENTEEKEKSASGEELDEVVEEKEKDETKDEQADPAPGEPSAVLAADAVGATVPEADADCGDVLKKENTEEKEVKKELKKEVKKDMKKVKKEKKITAEQMGDGSPSKRPRRGS